MTDLITSAIAMLIIVLMFAVPIAVIVIITLLIVKAVKKSNNNNTANYCNPPANANYQQIQYNPQQNYQNAQPAVPQNTYYRPPVNYTPPLSNYPPRYANQKHSNNQNFPYQAVSLLTEREYNFFRVLKVIADRNNMDVLMKVRLADLIKVSGSVPKNEFYKYFNKISAKHIDFILIDGVKIVALIELDDSTHNRKDRIERDNFVNETVTRCGYRIIHTYGDTKQIEDAVMQYRKPIINAVG